MREDNVDHYEDRLAGLHDQSAGLLSFAALEVEQAAGLLWNLREAGRVEDGSWSRDSGENLEQAQRRSAWMQKYLHSGLAEIHGHLYSITQQAFDSDMLDDAIAISTSQGSAVGTQQARRFEQFNQQFLETMTSAAKLIVEHDIAALERSVQHPDFLPDMPGQKSSREQVQEIGKHLNKALAYFTQALEQKQAVVHAVS